MFLLSFLPSLPGTVLPLTVLRTPKNLRDRTGAHVAKTLGSGYAPLCRTHAILHQMQGVHYTKDVLAPFRMVWLVLGAYMSFPPVKQSKRENFQHSVPPRTWKSMLPRVTPNRARAHRHPFTQRRRKISNCQRWQIFAPCHHCIYFFYKCMQGKRTVVVSKDLDAMTVPTNMTLFHIPCTYPADQLLRGIINFRSTYSSMQSCCSSHDACCISLKRIRHQTCMPIDPLPLRGSIATAGFHHLGASPGEQSTAQVV